MGLGHSKVVGVSDPTQGELDARIAMGQYAPGTVLADIALGSDWNADHVFSGGTAGSVLFLGGSGAIVEDNAGLYFDTTNNYLGIGTASPAARLHLSGSASQAAWTTSGIALRVAPSTYTDTSSSGTVAVCYANTFAAPTFAASSATTYTTAANVFIGNEPAAGTNVTITNAFSFIVGQKARFNSYVGIGNTVVPTSCLQIGTNQTAASWTTQGLLFHIGGQTLTDSTGSGTIASRVGSSIHQPAFASSSAVTVTNAATLYVEGQPTAGSNTTLTSAWAIWVDTGNLRLDGSVAVGVATAPTARLHLGAGTASASTAPLKFTSGTNLTTGEAGAMEYNGTNLFFTRTGTTRENVFVGDDGASAPSTNTSISIVNYYGSSSTNMLGTPNSWASVVIDGTTYKIPLYT